MIACIMGIYSWSAAKFMTKKVVTANVTSTLRSVCKSMLDNNVGSVVILNSAMEDAVPIGIITERDVVKLVSLIDEFNPVVPIRSFMSTPLVTGNPTMTLFKAMQIMRKNNIRRLPIIEKTGGRQKLVGIITEKDIANAIEKSHRNSNRGKKRIVRVRHVPETYKLPTQI
jgi:CBS domain-containing protein